MGTRDRDERGAATIFVLLIAVALLVGAGLVIDGGYALAERRKLATQAEQAARVGADALQEASLRDGGEPEVDPARARQAAIGYLNQVGAPRASVTIDGQVVTVRLRGESKTAILSIAGITHIPVAGAGSAESIDQDTR